MSSNESNLGHGLYRQVLDSSLDTGDLFAQLLLVYEELHGVLTYLGLTSASGGAQAGKLASLKLADRTLPVPGIWLGAGKDLAAGTPLYYDPATKSLVAEAPSGGTTALFAGIVDSNNNVICVGIRRLQII